MAGWLTRVIPYGLVAIGVVLFGEAAWYELTLAEDAVGNSVVGTAVFWALPYVGAGALFLVGRPLKSTRKGMSDLATGSAWLIVFFIVLVAPWTAFITDESDVANRAGTEMGGPIPERRDRRDGRPERAALDWRSHERGRRRLGRRAGV